MINKYQLHLSSENYTEFLDSYNRLYDAVINSIRYEQINQHWTATVALRGTHANGINNYRLQFIFNKPYAFSFREDNT